MRKQTRNSGKQPVQKSIQIKEKFVSNDFC